MHFGLYLVKHGAITPAQFITALECQLASRPQIGALAIELGKLTVKEVFQVLRSQADEPSKLFGELAQKAGMISEDDLVNLLYHQSVRVRPMAKIIVDMSFATADTMESHLNEYRASLNSSDESQYAIAK